jgi:hypothetical protein
MWQVCGRHLHCSARKNPTRSLSQFGHRKSGIKPSARLIIAPDVHEKMSSVRSADRRKRPRSGFGTALVPLSRPHPCGGLAKSSGSRTNRTLSAPSSIVPHNEIQSAFCLVSRTDSAEIAARIVGMPVAPPLHQLLEFGVVPIGQDNFRGHEQVAGSARLRQPLALETEGAARGRVLRNR